MDTVRYYVALLVVAFYPGALLVWFSVHPFVGFWRKVGAKLTLAIHYGFILAIAAGVYRMRRPVLAVEFGADWGLSALGVVLLAVAVAMRRALGRHLKPRILQGLPELAPDKRAGRLLTEGIYSRIRHPRYVQITIAMAGYALITNYLATYVLAVVGPPTLFLIVKLEERELRERFGKEYDDYCARVPRFIPNSRAGGQRSM